MGFKIFLSPPELSGKEQQYVNEAFQSNYIAPLGAFVNRLEEEMKSYTHSPNALALNSGTAALHLALRVSGIAQGDFVLASSFTFIGSINAILYQGAIPIFIDSDFTSWNLSPKLLVQAIESMPKKPKALIVTHLYGQCAKIAEIAEICAQYGILLIEDAAESLGAFYDGKHSGTFGEYGVLSFNGNKIITTSGGGMLLGKSQKNIEKARYYSTQARENLPFYEHLDYGYNYRLSNICAAIGVGQLEQIEAKVAKRREIFSWYEEALQNEVESQNIEFMPEIPNSRGNRWLSTLRFLNPKANPLKLVESLAKEEIESRPLWKPMHLQPIFRDSLHFSDGTSQQLFESGICLPSGGALQKRDIDRIANLVQNFLKSL
ncbi:UDP-N-acetylbacillosamine transaminase [Helicobacter sp. MIT 05-5294]|uniref:UDP-N-acetylbacillosamine transaminase n=1 Tax=Helicobacter sp. MIT 05-5294 TaxID=1548150 RepID=UPI0010FDF6CF|nr:UDP-N-acetylbacillosamine transaminase [Helicobacter sp. MIT 05-5294]TLD89213.1 UDP-N-acetylbacillosamine transaminase [Helicobacter sp. MIT 05-5294]